MLEYILTMLLIIVANGFLLFGAALLMVKFGLLPSPFKKDVEWFDAKKHFDKTTNDLLNEIDKSKDEND